MTLVVGLTGNVASGKSTVAGHWSALGVPVLSADELAREAVAPGAPALAEIEEVFGSEVLRADGTLDRDAMRARVFSDAEARRRLEAITHPRIAAARDRWTAERRAAGDPLVAVEIPLLFEAGLESDVDVVVVVDAPAPVRLERLVRDRGLDEQEARRIMAAQMDSAVKRERADVVVDNGGDLTTAARRAGEVLEELRARVGMGPEVMDLHLHTAGSWDCLSDPDAVVARALELGFTRIAMTDHNRLDVALRAAEEHPGRVIAGEEVKTAEGIDVIGLYLTEEIPRGTPAVETVDRIRAQGGIPYLPHPYAGGKGAGGKYAEDLAARVDVVEVFNARLHPGRLNRPAEELAARHARLRGAGSDAHTLGELGGARLTVPSHPSGPTGLRAALLGARIEGRTAPHWVHLASTWAKVVGYFG